MTIRSRAYRRIRDSLLFHATLGTIAGLLNDHHNRPIVAAIESE